MVAGIAPLSSLPVPRYHPESRYTERAVLIEAILAYLGAIGGPDRATWKLWLGVVIVGLVICLLIAMFR